MAKLSKKEKRLLVAFISILLLVGNVIGLKKYLDGVRLAKMQIKTLTEQKEGINALLSDREYWEERQNWMKSHQPQIADLGEAQGEMLESLQEEARARGITVLEQRILDPQTKQQYPRISVFLKVVGPMSDIVSWLSEIQAPESFRIVENLSLALDTRSKEEELPVICTLQIGRLYHAGNRSFAQ